MAEVGIAAQVYSVREEAEKDFPGTMKALKECGYGGVELAGLYGHSPEEVRDWLREQELVPVSAHVGLDLFQQDLEGTAEAYRMIGCRYIGIPYLPQERLPGGSLYEETCSFLREISRCCREKGMILLYHNHTFEFEKTFSGRFLLEELYEALGAEELQTELDTCWAKVAGEDPAAWLRKYRGRCPVVHMKDFRRGQEGVQLTALGTGEQDVAGIAGAALESGALWLVVEQDDHPWGSPMENMRMGCRCLEQVVSAISPQFLTPQGV